MPRVGNNSLCLAFLCLLPQTLLGGWIVCVCSVAQLCPTLCDPMDCSPPGSSVHGSSQQEHWSGLPFLPPGGPPDPGIETTSPTLAGRFFTTEPPGKPSATPLFQVLIPHDYAIPSLSAPPPHPSLPILIPTPVSPVSSSTTPRAIKSGYRAR